MRDGTYAWQSKLIVLDNAALTPHVANQTVICPERLNACPLFIGRVLYLRNLLYLIEQVDSSRIFV